MKLINNFPYNCNIKVKSYPVNGILLWTEQIYNHELCKIEKDQISFLCKINGKIDILENSKGLIYSKPKIRTGWNLQKIQSNHIKAEIKKGKLWINGKESDLFWKNSILKGLAIHKNLLVTASISNNINIIHTWQIR